MSFFSCHLIALLAPTLAAALRWNEHGHLAHLDFSGCADTVATPVTSEDTDIIMRSYRKDLAWLEYSVTSLTSSIACAPGVIRNIHLVVPDTDTQMFEDELEQIWNRRNLPIELRNRWSVSASRVKIPLNGYQEQMLDKMHSDFYTDATFVMFIDTDTVLMRDMTKDQVFDPSGVPYMCFRSVAKCGADCAKWMDLNVQPMLGDGQMLAQEYMCCLGQAYPSTVFPHLREQVAEHRGDVWNTFVTAALTQEGANPWVDPLDNQKGFTEFNAMGAVLWRDLHDSVHWLDANGPYHLTTQVRPMQTWSYESNQTIIDAQKDKFECVIRRMHETEFDYGVRNRECSPAI